MTILRANLPVSYVEKKSNHSWEIQNRQNVFKRILSPEKKIPKMISLDYFKINMFLSGHLY